jgi:transcriptional regulator with XRE-family HTH domain
MESISQIKTNDPNQKILGKTINSGDICLKSKHMPGTVIKQFREFRNYSQDYVAKKMGISQNAYSKIENNITQLTVTHVKQLSTILDVPVVDLLRDEFEIRKPHHLSTDHVTRKELLLYLHDFQHSIKLKREEDHKLYSAVMAILQTAYYVAEDIQ